MDNLQAKMQISQEFVCRAKIELTCEKTSKYSIIVCNLHVKR